MLNWIKSWFEKTDQQKLVDTILDKIEDGTLKLSSDKYSPHFFHTQYENEDIQVYFSTNMDACKLSVNGIDIKGLYDIYGTARLLSIMKKLVKPKLKSQMKKMLEKFNAE